MENTNKELYELLINNIKQLSKKILSMQLSYQPKLVIKDNDDIYNKYLSDISYHLKYLAEAITLNNLVIFNDYIIWVKSLNQNLNTSTANLEINLESMKDVLYSELPPKMSIITNRFIDAARKNLSLIFTSSTNFVDKNNVYFNILSKYLELVLKMQRIKASELIMGEVEKGTSIKDIYVYVFEPSLKEIGRLWQLNKITVVQEHYFTATTQLIMSQLYSKIFFSPKNGLKFVGACAHEEIHEVGIRMVTDILELDGWDTYYLGANLSKNKLMSFLIDKKPNVFGISVTMTFYLHKVIEIIEEIRNTQQLSCVKILVGGYAFNADKNLWKMVGADIYAPNAMETSDLLASIFKGGISYER